MAGSVCGRLAQLMLPVTVELTPTPNIGCSAGTGLLIDKFTSSVILIDHGKDTPCTPTYPCFWVKTTREPKPGSIISEGEPLNEKNPSESVVVVPISLSSSAALPGTFRVSLSGTRYSSRVIPSILEELLTNCNVPLREILPEE